MTSGEAHEGGTHSVGDRGGDTLAQASVSPGEPVHHIRQRARLQVQTRRHAANESFSGWFFQVTNGFALFCGLLYSKETWDVTTRKGGAVGRSRKEDGTRGSALPTKYNGRLA